MVQAGQWLRRMWPGLVVVAAAALVSQLVSTQVRVVSALLIAIVLGVLLRNTIGVPSRVQAGLAWSTRAWLRSGVVLLGFQLSLPQVARLGWRGIAVIVVTVAATYWATLGLGRALRVPPLLARLIATGFSICGAAAIAATSGIVDPEGEHEDDTATAVALVTLCGTLMIAVMPALAHAIGMDPTQTGMWIGASVHEVAQVVAAGTIAGSTALAIATVTKLGRVALLAPLAAGQSVLQARRAPTSGATKRPPLIPLFVLGFLLTMTVRSSGVVPGPLLHGIQLVATFLLTGAMFGLGSGVHVRSLARTGGRAVALGGAATFVAVAVAGGVIAIVS